MRFRHDLAVGPDLDSLFEMLFPHIVLGPFPMPW
jgi:hypothetical protein